MFKNFFEMPDQFTRSGNRWNNKRRKDAKAKAIAAAKAKAIAAAKAKARCIRERPFRDMAYEAAKTRAAKAEAKEAAELKAVRKLLDDLVREYSDTMEDIFNYNLDEEYEYSLREQMWRKLQKVLISKKELYHALCKFARKPRIIFQIMQMRGKHFPVIINGPYGRPHVFLHRKKQRIFRNRKVPNPGKGDIEPVYHDCFSKQFTHQAFCAWWCYLFLEYGEEDCDLFGNVVQSVMKIYNVYREFPLERAPKRGPEEGVPFIVDRWTFNFGSKIIAKMNDDLLKLMKE
jgi:hypothetical protein